MHFQEASDTPGAPLYTYMARFPEPTVSISSGHLYPLFFECYQDKVKRFCGYGSKEKEGNAVWLSKGNHLVVELANGRPCESRFNVGIRRWEGNEFFFRSPVKTIDRGEMLCRWVLESPGYHVIFVWASDDGKPKQLKIMFQTWEQDWEYQRQL